MPLYLCTIFFKHFCFSFLFGAVEKVCCILIIYHNNLVVGLPPQMHTTLVSLQKQLNLEIDMRSTLFYFPCV